MSRIRRNCYGETHAQMMARIRRMLATPEERAAQQSRPRPAVQKPLFYLVKHGSRAGWYAAE